MSFGWSFETLADRRSFLSAGSLNSDEFIFEHQVDLNSVEMEFDKKFDFS